MKIKRIFPKYCLILIITILMSSCGLIHKAVNKKYPPYSTLDQRMTSVNTETKKLESIDSLDAVLFVNNEDFKALANYAFESNKGQLDSINTKDISDVNMENLEFNFVEQGIDVAFDFEVLLKKYEIKLTGTSKGEAILEVNDSSVIVNLSLFYFHLNKVPRTDERNLFKRLGANIAIKFVNSVASDFQENINRYFVENPIAIPLNMDFAKSFDLNTLEPGGIDLSANKDINVHLTINSAIPFIDKKGILLFADRDTISINKNNPASNRSNAEFKKSFKHLEELADSVLIKDFDLVLKDMSKDNLFLLKKDFVADLLNSTLNDVDISLSKDSIYVLSEGKKTFKEEIRFRDKQILPTCEGLRRPFIGKDCGSCQLGSCVDKCSVLDCPSCKWHEAVCLAEKLACDAKNLVRKGKCTACIAEKLAEKAVCETKVATCKIGQEAKKVQNQVENEAKVFACQAKVKALEFVDGALKVAEIEGKMNVPSSNLTIRIKDIEFSDDLQDISVISDVGLYINTWLDVNVNPEGLGHIACMFNFNKTLENRGIYERKNRSVKMILENEEADDGIVLKAKTIAEKIDINIEPIPYYQLVSDPLFVLNCKLVTLAVPAIAGVNLLQKKDIPEALNIIFGTTKQEIAAEEFAIPIKPISIGDDNFQFELSPVWNNSTVGFYGKQK